MFKKNKQTDEKKEYSVSNEVVADLQKLAFGKWMIETIYKYTYTGLAREMQDLMNNTEARCGINKDEVDVDWSTVFKDNKIYAKPRPAVKPAEENAE